MSGSGRCSERIMISLRLKVMENSNSLDGDSTDSHHWGFLATNISLETLASTAAIL